jgi:hypothetical protein
MIWIFILFAALQVIDAYLTVRILSQGGRELNPMIAWFMSKLGVIPALVVLKGVGIAVVAGLVWSGNEYADEFLAVFCALYAGVVAWNYQQLRDQ